MDSQQEQIAQEAAEWVVKLSTEQCSVEDLQELQQWKNRSPEHLQAFEKLDHLIRGIQSLQQHHIDSDHRIIKEKVLAKKTRLPPHFSSFIIIMILGGLFYLLPWSNWTADVQNPVQGWQRQILEDSSQIQASGKTVYNIDYTPQHRTIELLQGNILVDVAKDADRPFVVDVGHAKIQALGTRFIVQHHDDLTIVSMLESKTRISAAQTQKTMILKTGESLMLNHGEIEIQQTSISTLQQAWENKKLVVQDMPLDQVLQILESYHSGHYIYAKAQLAHYPITAVLPLDQPEIALKLLSEHVGLRISSYTGYITHIEKD